MRGAPTIRALAGGLALLALSAARQAAPPAAVPDDFLHLLAGSTSHREAALARIAATWQPSSAVMLVETLYFLRDPAVASRAVRLLERRTGQKLGRDTQAWYAWIWAQQIPPHPHYAEFKSRLYRYIDPKFAAYFADGRPTRIRLDEVRWGGVVQDGIPPLRSPRMIPAAKAGYLADGDLIFGISVEGDARAYPQRILAWHEMFTDRVGGVPVAGVYCTLCGTVILYETKQGSTRYELGTSGFLYRSNKLMYDRATQSLWNTITGEPVIGPLASKDIRLVRRSVVTTTWGEWRRRHPDTTVLSLHTGYERDYSAGAAYHDYFATDELMFNVPELDRRLKNKAEVLALLFPESPGETLAIAQSFLLQHPVYQDRVGNVELVVLTDRSGANRVYARGGTSFVSWDQDRRVTAADGTVWTLGEDALDDGRGHRLPRLPAQRAFWFGWYAQFPETRLVR